VSISAIVFISILGLAGYAFYRSKKAAQLSYIKNYRFNSSIGKKVLARYPHLTETQVQLVFDGLREYFYICNMAKRRMVSMPSQVVDVAWHEFILFTRSYQTLCKKSLGRFLHHTPTEAMRTATLAQDGIKWAWRLSCAKNSINPANPAVLPLLFSIDTKLNIEDGFKYSTNCKDRSSPVNADGYCAGHIGCASGCAGDSGSPVESGGFFDSFGDSDGCGGGCGGD
jgi:hypothetical protein